MELLDPIKRVTIKFVKELQTLCYHPGNVLGSIALGIKKDSHEFLEKEIQNYLEFVNTNDGLFSIELISCGETGVPTDLCINIVEQPSMVFSSTLQSKMEEFLKHSENLNGR